MASGRGTGRVRERVAVTMPRRVRRRRSFARWGFSAAGLLVLLLVLDGVWVGATVAREADTVRDRLEDGVDSLLDGELRRAEASFSLATEGASRLVDAVNHPVFRVTSWLPALGDDVDAVRDLAGAASLVAGAGTSLTDAAGRAGWDGESIPGLETAATVDVELLSEVAPVVHRAASALSEADASLGAIDTGALTGVVREAVVAARDALERPVSLVNTAADLVDSLPGLLGAEGPRTHVVLLQTLANARGSGGHPGSYVLLRADGGAIDIGEPQLLSQVPNVEPVEASPEFEQRYGDFGSLHRLVAASHVVDFPTAAELFLELWDRAELGHVDGVVAVDSVWMSHVLEAIGYVQTSVWPVPIRSTNVSQIIDAETFELPQPGSDLVRAALATHLFDALLERPLEDKAFAEAMARSARERHLQVYSRDHGEQEALTRLGVAGTFAPADNAVAVVWDTPSNDSRTGYFAQKTVEYRVTLVPDGSARVRIELRLENTVERAEAFPSILFGQGDGLGDIDAFATAYLPPDAGSIRIQAADHMARLTEFGRPLAQALLQTEAGRTDSVVVTYEVPGVAVRAGEGWEYRLEVVPQPALRPDHIQIAIRLPDGVRPTAMHPAWDPVSGVLRWSGFPTEPLTLWARYAAGA